MLDVQELDTRTALRWLTTVGPSLTHEPEAAAADARRDADADLASLLTLAQVTPTQGRRLMSLAFAQAA